MNENNLVGVRPNQFEICGYTVKSAVEEISQDVDYQLTVGKELSVVDSSGVVVYQGIRGFLPIRADLHLVRESSGQWSLKTIKRSKTRDRVLSKVNLKFDDKCLMFDENGKIRYNLYGTHYEDLVC